MRRGCDGLWAISRSRQGCFCRSLSSFVLAASLAWQRSLLVVESDCPTMDIWLLLHAVWEPEAGASGARTLRALASAWVSACRACFCNPSSGLWEPQVTGDPSQAHGMFTCAYSVCFPLCCWPRLRRKFTEPGSWVHLNCFRRGFFSWGKNTQKPQLFPSPDPLKKLH